MSGARGILGRPLFVLHWHGGLIGVFHIGLGIRRDVIDPDVAIGDVDVVLDVGRIVEGDVHDELVFADGEVGVAVAIEVSGNAKVIGGPEGIGLVDVEEEHIEYAA